MEYETPHEILFPSDYKVDFTKEQLLTLIDIASNHHVRVNTLHVSYGEEFSEKQENNMKTKENHRKENHRKSDENSGN